MSSHRSAIEQCPSPQNQICYCPIVTDNRLVKGTDILLKQILYSKNSPARYLLLHAVQNIRNAVKNGLVSVLGFCTVVSYFRGCNWYSRFLLFFRVPVPQAYNEREILGAFIHNHKLISESNIFADNFLNSSINYVTCIMFHRCVS